MKARSILLLVSGLLSFAAVPASGDVLIVINENGVGSLRVNKGPIMPLPGAIGIDPTNGKMALIFPIPALFPNLNLNLTNGDLLMKEPPNPNLSPPSDIVRFHGSGICFYSDTPEKGEKAQLADLGIPQDRSALVKSVVEVGSEGSNGFFYVPKMGEPGFNTGQNGRVRVRVISDTPEPATLAGAVFGALALFGYARRRRRLVI
jgi:hypothetical protein